VQFGNNNTATVNMSEQTRQDLLKLLDDLRQQIQQANISAGAKQVLAEQIVPQMQQALKAPDPKPGLTEGLKSISQNLQVMDANVGHVAGIVGSLGKIAAAAGIAIKFVAPFVAGLL